MFICRLLIPIQDIVESEGIGVLNQYDADGHTPVHWAALGGHTHAMRYFAEVKVNRFCSQVMNENYRPYVTSKLVSVKESNY